jgi:hypothetical protein
VFRPSFRQTLLPPGFATNLEAFWDKPTADAEGPKNLPWRREASSPLTSSTRSSHAVSNSHHSQLRGLQRDDLHLLPRPPEPPGGFKVLPSSMAADQGRSFLWHRR